MTDRRSRSQERATVVRGTVAESEVNELTKQESVVHDCVISVYNSSHSGADLSLDSYELNHGLAVLTFSFEWLPSIRDLNNLLQKELLGTDDIEGRMVFDYKINKDSLVAFVPMKRILDSKISKKGGPKWWKLLLLVLLIVVITLYIAVVRLQWILL